MSRGSQDRLERSKVIEGFEVELLGLGVGKEKGKMGSKNMTFLETLNSLVFKS